MGQFYIISEKCFFESVPHSLSSTVYIGDFRDRYRVCAARSGVVTCISILGDISGGFV